MTDGVISLDGLAAICCCKFANEAADDDPAGDWVDAIEEAGEDESLLL